MKLIQKRRPSRKCFVGFADKQTPLAKEKHLAVPGRRSLHMQVPPAQNRRPYASPIMTQLLVGLMGDTTTRTRSLIEEVNLRHRYDKRLPSTTPIGSEYQILRDLTLRGSFQRLLRLLHCLDYLDGEIVVCRQFRKWLSQPRMPCVTDR